MLKNIKKFSTKKILGCKKQPQSNDRGHRVSYMNKRGVFFTILVIAILSLFAIYYSFYSVIKDRESINKRIETMNNFVSLVERDLPRQLYVSGYRIIFIMEKRITDTGSFIDDTNSSLQELFFNDSLEGVHQDLMDNSDFTKMQTTLLENGAKVNVIVNLTNPKISMYQEDPWRVKIRMIVDMEIRDQGNLVSWNKTSIVDAYIPISRFEDPIYYLNTSGKIGNKFNQTIYQPFSYINNNLTNHLNNSYYINNSLAPSFLDRLQGKLTPSPYGIESLVNLKELSDQGITVQSKSCVDYIYFSGSNPQVYTIAGMPSWFRIDNQSGRLAIYNISKYATLAS